MLIPIVFDAEAIDIKEEEGAKLEREDMLKHISEFGILHFRDGESKKLLERLKTIPTIERKRWVDTIRTFGLFNIGVKSLKPFEVSPIFGKDSALVVVPTKKADASLTAFGLKAPRSTVAKTRTEYVAASHINKSASIRERSEWANKDLWPDENLKKIGNESIAIYKKDKRYFAPRYVSELKRILKKNINSQLLSGGTDLSLLVTKDRKDINSTIYMNSIKELNYIKNNNKYIEVGATTSLSNFETYIKKYYPDFNKILKRYGSIQIRNVATIAGNIATASPIGDNLPLLLALDSQIVLQGIKKTKILPINDFFISYRKTKLKEGQFIHSIRIPIFDKNIFKAYKISKRFDDDISSVCAAFNLFIENKKIKKIKIAYGGMAAIPKRAIYCERALMNSLITKDVINKAKNALEKDFLPISDMRASGKYRKIIAKNLLEKCFLEINEKKIIGLYN